MPVTGNAAAGGADFGSDDRSLGGASEGGQPHVETCAERAPTCPAASVCSHAPEGEICRYAPELAMLTYVGNDINGGPSLVAAPLSLAAPLRLDWSAAAEDGKFVIPWSPLWAPNGQALVFFLTPANFLSDFSRRYYWMDLSLAAPLAPMRIPNIPVNDENWSTRWSPNSRRLLVYQAAGAFVIDFARGRATTTRVGESGQTLTELAFCADGSIAYDQDGTAFIAPAASGQLPTHFEQAIASVSPGGRWLLLSDGTTDYVAACTPGATAHALQQASSSADWSSDADYLALADRAEEPVMRSLWHLGSAGPPQPLMQVSSSAWGLAWQPRGARLLYQAWQDDAPGTFHALDLSGEPIDLALPIASELTGDPHYLEVSWVAQSSKVLERYIDEDGDWRHFLLDAADATAPILALGATAPDWFSSDGEQMLSIEEQAEGSQAWLSRVGAPAERRALFAQPLACDLRLRDVLPGAAPLLECTDTDARLTLYAVATDLLGARKISDGTYADDPALRPLP